MQADFDVFVRRRARELGLSLAEVARRAGLSRQAIYKLLDGAALETHLSTFVIPWPTPCRSIPSFCCASFARAKPCPIIQRLRPSISMTAAR